MIASSVIRVPGSEVAEVTKANGNKAAFQTINKDTLERREATSQSLPAYLILSLSTRLKRNIQKNYDVD